MLDLNTKFGRIARKHLKSEYFIWLTTVDSTGTPRPRPVWFLWQDDTVLIFSQAKAYKVRHIKKNPKVALHFNTEDVAGDKRVIVFAGEAVIDEKCPPAHKVRAYLKKYRSGIANLEIKMTPEEFGSEYSIAIRIRLTEVRGWG
jgi:PPOX class probable F420-dependent enzyme